MNFKNFANKYLDFSGTPRSGDILKIELKGGLCNKLFCLFSACEIAQKLNCQILEPDFGWKRKILFSDIYDIAYFNEQLLEHFNGKDVMVSKADAQNGKTGNRIRKNKTKLWKYSQANLSHLRKDKVIHLQSMMVYVMKALRLKPEYQRIIEENSAHEVAVQLRIETDWVKYSKEKKAESNEIFLIDLVQMIDMLGDRNIKEVFFTTGENQKDVQSLLHENQIKASFFYEDRMEYEINAAINFEILCRSGMFVGLSRSTFSNLITLKRELILQNSNNYIYNYGNAITQRVDYGLYPAAGDSVSITPEIIP